MRGISPEINEAHRISQFLARTGAPLRCPLFKIRYPRRLHFLRQFRSCPENITGEGVMDGVMKVCGGVTDGVMKVL